MASIAQAVEEFILSEGNPAGNPPEFKGRASDAWRRLRELGTRPWLDTGDLDEAQANWSAEFEALTTNNTLLNKEVQKGIYDALIPGAAAAVREADPAVDEDTLILEIAFILNARHALKLVRRFGAFVSVELHTALAHDVERSVEYGRRYFAICPERFIVKIPMTAAGFLSARRLAAEGIPINFTLGFSARQNYLAALLANPQYVNVFLGRLNGFVADNKLGSGDNIGEKAVLATQRELLQLRESDGTVSKLIAASMRNGRQVATLAGVDVMTMPVKVAGEFASNPPADLKDRVSDDPQIELNAGARIEDFGGAALWETPAEFKRAVGELVAARQIDMYSPHRIIEHFIHAGFPDLLPHWTEEEEETAAQNGKIPKFLHWRNDLASGRIGLDALLNLSALQSFIADQKELDDRIRRTLDKP